MTDITELFNRDPMKLTNEDITQIIADMRQKRQLYKAAPALSSGGAKSLTEKQKKVKSALNLDIDI